MSLLKTLEDSINQKEDELAELHKAYNILKQLMPAEQSAPPPSPLKVEIPEKTAEPAPSLPKPIKPQGPRCGACGAGMYPTYRTMPSGAVVNLLKCNDSGCGNEAYQS